MKLITTVIVLMLLAGCEPNRTDSSVEAAKLFVKACKGRISAELNMGAFFSGVKLHCDDFHIKAKP